MNVVRKIGREHTYKNTHFASFNEKLLKRRFVVFIQLIDMAYVQEVIAKTLTFDCQKSNIYVLKIPNIILHIHSFIFYLLFQTIPGISSFLLSRIFGYVSILRKHSLQILQVLYLLKCFCDVITIKRLLIKIVTFFLYVY